MGQSHIKLTVLLTAILVLPGCLKETGAGQAVTRFVEATPISDLLAKARGEAGSEAPTDAETGTDTVARAETTGGAEKDGTPEAVSPIIRSLQERRAIVAPGTPYAEIAASVMASDARVAEAELQAAQLREKAASRNWLPTIGPRVSLNSLGDLVADLVINQVLFDNGRKTAERDFAKADVELAAVALSEDGNTRVHDALSLYIQAEEGRADAALATAALKDMEHFEWIMNERVKGGVANPSDLTVLRQKLSELRARRDAAREAEETAMAELNAMAARPVSDLRGLGGLGEVPVGVEAISVLQAQAERDRAIAEARIARASHLPGLSIGGSVGDSGDQTGLMVQAEKLLGLGTGASLKALETAQETAKRKVAEAREDSQRKLGAEKRRLVALRRQAEEARVLTHQAKANLDLFQRQYDGGQRQVMDVVGVYETFVVQQKTMLDLRMKAHRSELAIARLMGVLADGAGI